MTVTKNPTIRSLQGGKEHFGEYRNAANLLEYLNTETPFDLKAPCGGKGRCGKCRVLVESGELSPTTEEERRLLGEKELARGVRLACMTKPLSDAVIVLGEEKKTGGNKTALFPDAFEAFSGFRKKAIGLTKPTLEDQTSDHDRLLRETGEEGLEVPLTVLRDLPAASRRDGGKITLCSFGKRAVAVEAGDTTKELYGVAVDIGTTTVAAYLVDLAAGRNIDVLAGLNAQGAFGADVISRIHHAGTASDGLELLRERIVNQIDGMIKSLAERNAVSPERIYGVSLAGNTTMIHLALGLPPAEIASAPFIPASVRSFTLPARDFPFSVASGGLVQVLPGVASYVGADITAAVLASGLAEQEDLSLLIDIGTNGEIVLGNSKGLVSCSTAAGPAFEGAHIRNGVGGVAGAVRQVAFSEGSLRLSTILDESPIGLCGSGIADLLAVLLETGLVDDTGRMLDPEEAGGKPLAERLVLQDGEPAFLLVPKEEAAIGGDLLFTQKDVREIQLAKAAIAAGIDTLVKTAKTAYDDVKHLYLAGGFGNYIDKTSAVKIGLLPKSLYERIEVLGNAAGKGAVLVLASEKERRKCEDLARRVRYVELSSSPEFQDAYIERMCFSPD